MRADIAWEYEIARLVATRHRQGITQQELAHTLGSSPNGLHEWETGKRQPRITTWLRWRAALGLAAPWQTYDHDQRKQWRAAIVQRKRNE